ncbi:MAG: hypothetical protein Q4B93_05130 [Clostridia bacterium]|nr:hypothetical protein [Clostridia bacterium]
MAKFFKWTLISILVLISLPILLVCFILVGMGIAAIHEKFEEKNQPSQGITQKVYSDGRHTIVSFGNKKFSIEKGVWDGETTKCLIDRKKSGPEATIDYIEKYKEVLSYVYTLGEKGYTKLNYDTGEVIQSKNINDFSEEDKNIFNSFED